MSERERDMSTGSFISLLLMLILIAVVSFMIGSQMRDLQRRVGQLESAQQVRR